MVERIEQIHSKLEFGLLRDVCVFVEGKVAVVDSGPMKYIPARSPHGTECIVFVTGRIEVVVSGVACRWLRNNRAVHPDQVRKRLNIAWIRKYRCSSYKVRSVPASVETDHWCAL